MLVICYHHFSDCYLWQKVVFWEQPGISPSLLKREMPWFKSVILHFPIYLSCWHASGLARIGSRPLLFFCGRVVTLPSLSHPCLILDPKVQAGLIRAGRTLGRLPSMEGGLVLVEMPCGPMNEEWEGRARHVCIHSLSDFHHLQMIWTHGVSAVISCLLLLPPLLLSSSPLHCTLSPGPWWNWSWGLVQPGCLGLITISIVNSTNTISQYFESFLCVDLDQSISLALFWALTGDSPLRGKNTAISS